MKKTAATIFILAVLCAGFPAHSETIYLKNGKVIHETIIERGSYYIVTKTENNVPKKYFQGEIEKIVEDEPAGGGYSERADLAGMPADKDQLILQFIDVSGVRNSMEQNIKQVIAQAPENQREGLRDIFRIDEIIERIVPIYDKFYTQDDLKEMIKFYQSPIGQKAIEVTPQIMKEALTVSIEYIKERAAPRTGFEGP